MGIFNNMFGGKEGQEEKLEKKTYLTWLPLTSLEQLERIETESNAASVLIFKDSTRCGISKMVIKQFEKLFTEENQHLKVYYLDLLNYRDISNEIAVKFQVMHQSPQLIVVRNGSTVHHASHNDITETELNRFL